MAHAIWKGSISFGLVTIPVGLYTAESRDEIDLDLLDERDMAPIGYQRINKVTGKPVESEHIVKGYKVESGDYVIVTEEDIAAANVEATQTVEILEFVAREEIDPAYFERPYYVAPLKGGAKAYALLREALRRSGRVGIGQLVIRTRQYVAAVYPQDDAIVVDLLRYAHELRGTDELDLPKSAKSEKLSDKELQMAARLVESMVGSWQPERFQDTYRDDLLALIHEKAKRGGAEPLREVPERPEPAGGEVVDLMELLKRSMAGGRAAAGSAPHGRSRRAAAAKPKPAARRKPAAKRAAKTTARKPAARKPAKRAPARTAAARKSA